MTTAVDRFSLQGAQGIEGVSGVCPLLNIHGTRLFSQVSNVESDANLI